MATNNAVNMSNYLYYFCVKLSTDKLNVTGDTITNYAIPYDIIVQDNWNIYNSDTYTFTLPKSGQWALGMSIKYTDNYATFQALTAAFTTTLGGDIFNKPLYIRDINEGSGAPTSQTELAFMANYPVSNTLFGNSMYSTVIFGPQDLQVEYTVWSATTTNDAGILYDAAHPTMAWGYLINELPSPF